MARDQGGGGACPTEADGWARLLGAAAAPAGPPQARGSSRVEVGKAGRRQGGREGWWWGGGVAA